MLVFVHLEHLEVDMLDEFLFLVVVIVIMAVYEVDEVELDELVVMLLVVHHDDVVDEIDEKVYVDIDDDEVEVQHAKDIIMLVDEKVWIDDEIEQHNDAGLIVMQHDVDEVVDEHIVLIAVVVDEIDEIDLYLFVISNEH